MFRLRYPKMRPVHSGADARSESIGLSTQFCAYSVAGSTCSAGAMHIHASLFSCTRVVESSHAFPSAGDELMVGTLRHVVPRAHERLELRERSVNLPGHGALLRFVPDDLGRQLSE